MKIIVVGVRHKRERAIEGVNRVDKKQIFDILDRVKPGYILLEKGYFYELGIPMGNPSDKYIKSYYAVDWANRNNIKFEFVDYKETTDEKSLSKISLLRERAFCDNLIEKSRDYKVIGFFGENHRAKMNALLPKGTESFSIANSNIIEKFFVLKIERVKIFIRRLFRYIK